jgi:uncharacterized membrane protein YjjP (DUF1212 family)
MFVVKNTDMFVLNSDIHNTHTRQSSDLHHPIYKLTEVQKGVSYSGITIFNNLPQNIKNLSSDVNKFKNDFKKILYPGWLVLLLAGIFGMENE